MSDKDLHTSAKKKLLGPGIEHFDTISCCPLNGKLMKFEFGFVARCEIFKGQNLMGTVLPPSPLRF